MKRTLNKLLPMLLAVAMMFTALFASGASGAGTSYFVNTSGGTVNDLGSLYAIGSGGTAVIGSTDVYALTSSGMSKLDGSVEITGLSVSGTISLSTTNIKVGLYYYYSASRDTSLSSANLQNVTGSGNGYAFGYYDSNRSFVSLGAATGADKISMLVDRNMYYQASTNTYYEGTSGSSVVVGCYHIRLSGSYSTYSAACSAASAYSAGFVKYDNGSFYAMVGNYTSSDLAVSGAASLGISGYSVDSGTSYTVTIVETGTSKVLFEYDCGTASYLAVQPQHNGKAATWFKGYKYYGSFEYKRINGDKMTVVNVVDIEDYVKGVVPHEMSDSWPIEALKAQAVCARTYAMANINGYSKYGFDLTCDTYSQAYSGLNLAGSNTNSAVDATAGVYLTHSGKLCDALYSSSHGGASESNINVNGISVPYLIGIIDQFEPTIMSIIPSYEWTYSYTPSQLSSKLSSYGISTVSSVTPAYSDTGNMISLKITDINGKSVTFERGRCRTGMGFPSIHYTVQWDSASGKYVFSGAGLGHNVGMSQYGAYAMSKVYGYTYDQILNYYYTDVSLSAGVVK